MRKVPMRMGAADATEQPKSRKMSDLGWPEDSVMSELDLSPFYVESDFLVQTETSPQMSDKYQTHTIDAFPGDPHRCGFA